MTKVVHRGDDDDDDDDEGGDNSNNSNNHNKDHWELRRTHVVEQRVSNLAQGLLTLGTMTGPLLVVLHLIPQGVLAGLFFIMGYQALEGNGITAKILFLARDGALTDKGNPLGKIRRRGAVWLFVAVELAAFGATFAITQTVAAVGFPCFIMALIPVRAMLLPRWFTPQELAVLDGPTASPFTMESVGGAYGGEGSDADADADAVADGGPPRDGAPGDGLFDGGRDGGAGEQELAELGENKSVRLSGLASGPRRRNSAVGRDDDGESVETRRSGVNRRHAGKAQE